jgi:DUF4097 and DUF4098 domain-containing protein YvlB
MKPWLALTGITLAVCSLAVAQEPAGDRVVVPARNSTRPRKLDVQTMNGTILIKAYNGKEVIVETRASSNRRESERTVNGMRRIDIAPRGLTVEEEDNVITVRTRVNSDGELLISVPSDTSVSATSHNGNIEIESLTGEFDLQANNGHLTLNNVSGSVVAHSLNGPIKVSMNKVDPTKPLSFSTLNGSIEATLPADWKANVKLTTNHGEIWSDFDFKLSAGGIVTQQNNTSDGKFKVTTDRGIVGTVNGGGPEATFRSFNGKIFIKKK